MKKLHICKVTTLKNQEWWKKLSPKSKEKGTYLFCQHISNLQVNDEKTKYYHEVANEGQRGAVATDDISAGVFDIAVNPSEGTMGERVKEGFLSLLREKIMNDLVVYAKMVEDMQKKGLVDSSKTKIEPYEVASKIIEYGGIYIEGLFKMTKKERVKAIKNRLYVLDEKKKKIRNAVKTLVEESK